jgi:hypothetical protein
MKQFASQITAERSSEALMADALQAMTVPLARHGYKLDAQTPTTLTYVSEVPALSGAGLGGAERV